MKTDESLKQIIDLLVKIKYNIPATYEEGVKLQEVQLNVGKEAAKAEQLHYEQVKNYLEEGDKQGEADRKAQGLPAYSYMLELKNTLTVLKQLHTLINIFINNQKNVKS